MNEHAFALPTDSGKVQVRAASLESNKGTTLHQAETLVAMAASPDGNSLFTSHLDGCIYRYLNHAHVWCRDQHICRYMLLPTTTKLLFLQGLAEAASPRQHYSHL